MKKKLKYRAEKKFKEKVGLQDDRNIWYGML